MSGGTDSMVLNLQSGFRDQVKRIDFRESKLEKVRPLCLSVSRPFFVCFEISPFECTLLQ